MAWYFHDSTSRVTVPSGGYMDLLTSGNGATISVWFLVLNTGVPDGSHQHFIYHRSGVGLTQPNTPSLRIQESTNNVIPILWDNQSPAGASTSIDCTHSPGTGNDWRASGWVHAVQTFTHSEPASRTGNLTRTSNFYLNGALAVTDSQDGLQSATGITLIFGRRGNVSTEANLTLSGCIAEFAKFDRVLSPTEITQLYRGHDPELLSNGAPTVYFPMRNDFVDRRLGLTGVQVNVLITGNHPIPDKFYSPINLRQVTLPQLDGRLGKVEERGFLDYVYWTPGTVGATGISQTGAFFSQAKLGDGYIIAPNRSLSGCLVSAYASGGNVGNSGFLQIIVSNISPLSVDLNAEVKFSVYRL